MLLTDAVNETIMAANDDGYLTKAGIVVQVTNNKVSLTDEFGTLSRLFTDNDPNITSKVRSYWGDFLQRRTQKLRERMESNDTTERWYEIHLACNGEIVKRKTLEEVVSLLKSDDFQDLAKDEEKPWVVFSCFRNEIDPLEEEENP